MAKTSPKETDKDKNIEIVYVRPSDLQAAEYNPRVLSSHKEAQIRKSLLKYGFKEPVIVNMHETRKNVIVGGHQRVRIATELGLDKIPAVFVFLPLEQEKELNIRLNDGGDWDYDKMKGNFEASILHDTGFEDVLGFDFAENVLTKPTAAYDYETGQTARAAEAGEEVTAKVIMRFGSFSGKVDSKVYLAWKAKMHKDLGYSDAVITEECLRRLGVTQ